jgi:hypothetical protein
MANQPSLLVSASFEIPGLHCWPDAPNDKFYLRNFHRHMFYITLVKRVLGDNREIEFISLKEDGLSWFTSTFHWSKGCYDLGERSCEQIGLLLMDFFDLDCCKVFEDNENGSILIKENENALLLSA